MFEFLNLGRKTRAEPKKEESSNKSNTFTLWVEQGCTPSGYVSLVNSPEVKSGVEKIAEIVSLMTLHLMENSDTGDKRVKNALSKKIDVSPNKFMNRQLFISWIVQEMILRGNAIVLPKSTTNGENSYIDDLIPIPFRKRAVISEDYGYNVEINYKHFSDEEVLNFRFNPDLNNPWIGKGQEILLKDFINNLAQANTTTKDFMENKMLPSIIVKVQGLTDEMDNEDGRDEIEKRFLKRARSGQPWIVPSELIDVEEIRPITLQDIAIDKTIKLNKESVASILGIPAFLLGVGQFNKAEYNQFIKTKISVICKAIEQELTKKILIRDDWYFKFNSSSLLSYDLPELASVYSELYIKGLVTGNEVRDKLGLSTLEKLDKLVILENFIPVEDIGNQKKLEKGGQDGKGV